MLDSMDSQRRDWLEWLGGHLNWVLIAAIVCVGGIYFFLRLADVVLEGKTQRFDEYAIRAMRRADNPAIPIGPAWLPEVGRDLTALGGVAVLTLMTIGIAGYLAIARKFAAMAIVLASTLTGLLLSSVLKHLVMRDRPNIVPHLSGVYTTSFPSGHSMLSAIVYLTLGSLLARVTESRRLKIYFLAIAMTLTILVGVSRVYMGVHYPTDVLAGWLAGLVWALLCWMVTRYLQHRGRVEQPG